MFICIFFLLAEAHFRKLEADVAGAKTLRNSAEHSSEERKLQIAEYFGFVVLLDRKHKVYARDYKKLLLAEAAWLYHTWDLKNIFHSLQ